MIVSIVGARPQFVKAAVVSSALKQNKIDEIIIHTGQHYDEKLSRVFWEELELPDFAVNLEVGSGLQGSQTATMIKKLEEYLIPIANKISAILLYGDTNSTLAGSIVAAKLNLPIMHVEAGLRSFNRTMPEEINRIVTDHLSSVLFCSSSSGVSQLATEGITGNVFDTGDVMYDAIETFGKVSESKIKLDSVLPFTDQVYCVLTLHRPSNTDADDNINSILKAMASAGMPVLWPLHPRLKDRISKIAIPENVYVVSPLSYFEMLCALKNCYKVFTDSGGLQKEAYWMQKPCITLRDETEWTETLQNNWNILTGADTQSIEKAFSTSVDSTTWHPLYGNGNAADKIAKEIKRLFYS
jgi:UDP-N-acetylglucosamine 2-epimerase